MRLVLFFALLFLPCLSFAETAATNAAPSAPAHAPVPPKTATTTENGTPSSSTKASHSQATVAQMQATIDQLSKSNHDLLDLLKQQQSVLEDMQFEHRQQNRQFQSLEERLETTLLQNADLEKKVASLEADAAVHPSGYVQPPTTTRPQAGGGITGVLSPSTNAPPAQPAPTPAAETPPPPPSTYLPPPESEGAPGTKSWHRLFILKGQDGKQSDLFHIQGRNWRVLWHNQDPPEKKLKGTSGLFINAFPKDDTIPQMVCSKVGSGGDSAELVGPGNYYLKIEASGGSWEVAVEDFR